MLEPYSMVLFTPSPCHANPKIKILGITGVIVLQARCPPHWPTNNANAPKESLLWVKVIQKPCLALTPLPGIPSYLVQLKLTAHRVPQVNSSMPTCYVMSLGTMRQLVLMLWQPFPGKCYRYYTCENNGKGVNIIINIICMRHYVATSEALGPGSVLVSRGNRESLGEEECL